MYFGKVCLNGAHPENLRNDNLPRCQGRSSISSAGRAFPCRNIGNGVHGAGRVVRALCYQAHGNGNAAGNKIRCGWPREYAGRRQKAVLGLVFAAQSSKMNANIHVEAFAIGNGMVQALEAIVFPQILARVPRTIGSIDLHVVRRERCVEKANGVRIDSTDIVVIFPVALVALP